MTLNEIAQSFCDAVRKPFDFQYIQRIKFAIKYWRATLIRQDFERNGISRGMLQSFITPLIKVDSADTCIVNIGCKVLRSKNKVPKPVRIKGSNAFHFVGSINIHSPGFTEVDYNELQYVKYKKYTSKIPRFVYINEYLYVYTDGKFKYIRVNSVFEDPEKAMNLCAENCPDDNDEFPIGADMLQVIFKGLISGEMQVQTDDLEITQNNAKN